MPSSKRPPRRKNERKPPGSCYSYAVAISTAQRLAYGCRDDHASPAILPSSRSLSFWFVCESLFINELGAWEDFTTTPRTHEKGAITRIWIMYYPPILPKEEKEKKEL
jgi:hypothetical protein